MPLHLALYEPDIPQNVGAALRLGACLGMPVDIIEPTTFIWDAPRIRRAAMDYIDHVTIHKYASWKHFTEQYAARRIVLLTTKSSHSYLDFEFRDDDILLAGRASTGVPQEVHDFCENRITIKMSGGARSLNIVNACAMVAGEALRQVK